MNLTGIILAGGKSSRLGFDKCKIKFDEYTIVESLILKLKQICDEIIISENSNSFHNENCYSQHDEIEDIGPIGGIYSSINKSKNFKNIIVSCDTPFLNIQYLNFMYEQSLNYDITYSISENKSHVVAGAVYTKNMLLNAEKLIDQKNYKLMNLINSCNSHSVDIKKYKNVFSEYLLTNINTLEDYETALKIFELKIKNEIKY